MTVTPLAITVLALLNERDMHPYEMVQLLRQRHRDRLVKLRPGSLYHTVARLDRDELVATVGTDRDGNRPERTTYTITDTGRGQLSARVAEMLGTPASEYPQFTLALSEAHNLDGTTVARLLLDRIALLEHDLDTLDAYRAAFAEPGKPRAFWFHIDYQRAMTRTEIDWLRHTVDELRSGALPWLGPDGFRAAGAAAASTHLTRQTGNEQ